MTAGSRFYRAPTNPNLTIMRTLPCSDPPKGTALVLASLDDLQTLIGQRLDQLIAREAATSRSAAARWHVATCIVACVVACVFTALAVAIVWR